MVEGWFVFPYFRSCSHWKGSTEQGRRVPVSPHWVDLCIFRSSHEDHKQNISNKVNKHTKEHMMFEETILQNQQKRCLTVRFWVRVTQREYSVLVKTAPSCSDTMNTLIAIQAKV